MTLLAAALPAPARAPSILVILTVLLMHPPSVQGQNQLPTHVIHDRVATSVVKIVTNCGAPGECSRSGSGVVVSVTDGSAIVATNAHVIEDATSVEVQFRDGRRTAVESFINVHPAVDVALFQIDDTGLEPVQPADLESLKIGHRVVVIGSPLGIDHIVSEAVLNGCVLLRNELGPPITAYATTGGTILGGSSGGGVFDRSGRIIGVAVGTITEPETLADTDIDFVIPFSHVTRLLDISQQDAPLSVAHTRAVFGLYRTGQMVAPNLETIEEEATEVLRTLASWLSRSAQEDLSAIAERVSEIEQRLTRLLDTMAGGSIVVPPPCPN